MSVGGLSDLLGMGVAIQLRNMFSIPALAVEKSSRALTNSIVGDQKTITNGFRLMGGGAMSMLLGAGVIGLFAYFSKHVLQASSDMELLRKQISLLAKSEPVGGALFDQMKQFSLSTPFTIDKIAAAGKSLLSFGFTADRVMGQLRTVGEWASIMNIPIEQAAWNIGKIRTGGIAMAMRFLQSYGIGYADIMAAGGPIDPKTMRTKKGANPEDFLRAVNKVIEEKFAGGMAIYMTTLPGMITNLKDQMIYAAAEIGDQIKPAIKGILTSILSVFRPGLILPFAHAVGQGLLMILHWMEMLLMPLAKLVVWFMSLAQSHPGVIKLAMGIVFLTGALMLAGGAAMVLVGAFKVLTFLAVAPEIMAIGSAFVGMLGPIGWVAAALAVLYTIWKNNILGIGTAINTAFSNVRDVFTGVVALISTLVNGQGRISKAAYDALARNGLLGIVVNLFMLFYRAKLMVEGLWLGITDVIGTMASLGAMVMWAFYPFNLLIQAVWKLLEGLGIVTNAVNAPVWFRFGREIGWIVGAMVAARAITMLWNGTLLVTRAIIILVNGVTTAITAAIWLWNTAVKGVTLAQWLLNIAMDANPIGFVIGAIALFITMAVLWIANLDKITNWFRNLPMWAKVLVVALGGIWGILTAIVTYSETLKTALKTAAAWVSDVWTRMLDGIWNRIMGIWNWIKRMGGNVVSMFVGDTTNPINNPQDGAPGRLSTTQMTRLLGDSWARDQKAADAAYAKQQGLTQSHVEAIVAAVKSQPIIVNHTTTLDGKVLGRCVTQYQRGRVVTGSN